MLVDEGVTSFKLFMAYPGVFYSDDGQILRAMQTGRRERRPDHDARRERHRHRRARRAGARPRARPTRATTATSGTRCWRPRRRTARSSWPRSPARRSTSCTSRREKALAEVAAARDEGCNVFGETCPQYLFLSTDDLARAGLRGRQVRLLARRCGPREHQAALWRGLRTNDLSVVSTDHCPFCFKGQKELGRGDFSKIPNGLPGVENRMDLLHQGVVDGHISPPPLDRDGLRRPRRGCSGCTRARARSRPARTPTSSSTTRTPSRSLSAATHHMNVDYSGYEGSEITGRVRDRAVARAGRDRRRRVPGAAGHGAVPPRATPASTCV